MAQVVQQKCPNCSAVLPPVGEASRVRCEYCGHTFDVKHTVAAPAVPPPSAAPFPAAQRPHFPAASAGGARRGCGMAAFPFVLAIGIAAFVFWRISASTGGFGLDVPGLTGGGAKLTWNETVGLFAINGDAIEDPIFVARQVLGGDEMFVIAFDGTSMNELWRSPSLGNYSQAYQYTHAVVVGNRVVVTDFRARALLLDLATGVAVATAQLPDRARELCGSPSGGTVLWAKADNGRNATIDTATGFVQPAPQSPFGETCAAPPDRSIPAAQTATPSLSMPGFEASEVLAEGGVSVAVGQRDAGIRVPMVVGLSAQGAGAWQMVPLSVDEGLYVNDSSHPTIFRLGGGRLFVAYSLQNDEGRLVALDARSGARLWESPVPKCCAHGVDIEGMRVGPTRVVTEQFGQAEVWDAQTGALVGRISVW